jgi:hypothetical protein
LKYLASRGPPNVADAAANGRIGYCEVEPAEFIYYGHNERCILELMGSAQARP